MRTLTFDLSNRICYVLDCIPEKTTTGCIDIISNSGIAMVLIDIEWKNGKAPPELRLCTSLKELRLPYPQRFLWPTATIAQHALKLKFEKEYVPTAVVYGYLCDTPDFLSLVRMKTQVWLFPNDQVLAVKYGAVEVYDGSRKSLHLADADVETCAVIDRSDTDCTKLHYLEILLELTTLSANTATIVAQLASAHAYEDVTREANRIAFRTNGPVRIIDQPCTSFTV